MYRCYLSLVCIFKMAIKDVEAKIDVPKGVLGFREENDNRCVGFMQVMFLSIICHMVILLNDYLVHSYWSLHLVLGFHKLEAHS